MRGRPGHSGRPRRTRQARPHRRRADLSQHFLRRESTARRLVELAAISSNDLVIEAGAGDGALTAQLADRASRVIAVELDRTLYAHLIERFQPIRNVTVRDGDFLAYSLPAGDYCFFANPPFDRTADIVRKIGLGRNLPSSAFILMETAAARRFLGQPFGPESALSLMLKARFEISVLAWLGPEEFSPPPSVNSVFLRFERRASSFLPSTDIRHFDRFARSMFRSERPVARGPLSHMLPRKRFQSLARELGFPPESPPSKIAFEQWLTAFNIANWDRET